MVDFDQPFYAPLIERDVRFGRDGHECEGQACLRIEHRFQLPIAPAVVVFRNCQAKSDVGLRLREPFVAPFARKERGQEGVVGLANHQDAVAPTEFFFHQDHTASLDRSLRTIASSARIHLPWEASSSPERGGRARSRDLIMRRILPSGNKPRPAGGSRVPGPPNHGLSRSFLYAFRASICKSLYTVRNSSSRRFFYLVVCSCMP